MGIESGRVVVTGGGGFLGSHLCEELLRRGARVVCVDNFSTGREENLPRHPRLELVRGDVARGVDVSGPVDTVLHLACPASPADYLRRPVETMRTGGLGTMCALELARRTGARFVLASTSEVYGDPLEHPQRESYWGNVNPIGPRSVYDEAKRFAEALTFAHRREYSVDTGVARIFNSYGPRMRADDGRMIPTFLRQATRGEPLTVAGDGTQTRSLCYVDDTIRGLVALAGSDLAGPVNLGGPDELTVLEIAEHVLRVTGSRSPIHHVDAMVDDPRRRCPDISLAEQALDWKPEIDIQEGLRRILVHPSRRRVVD